MAREVTVDDLDDHLAEVAAPWLALVPDHGDDVYEAEFPDRAVVLLIGGEGQGLDAPALARADRRVTLPMNPPVESLNATVAAGLVLYEIRRRRTAPTQSTLE